MRVNRLIGNRSSGSAVERGLVTKAVNRALLGCLLLILGTSGMRASEDLEVARFCHQALDRAELQFKGFRETYTDPAKIPRSFGRGQVRLVDPSDWTSGFVAGSFWLLYDHTQEPDWREAAEQWTEVLESQKYNTTTHDLGFMLYNSFGNGFRLTENPAYRDVLLTAAESLMSRYHPIVGATRSWDHGSWTFPVIVDNLMNLELLYWASKSAGKPEFASAANSHAVTTLNNHIRPDDSSWHVVDFDPASGSVIWKGTHQGIADDSTWARGQAWGLYGFTLAYRESRDRRFLETAVRIADFYLSHQNLPADKVPWFDFDVPDYQEIENIRDSSAAAIAVSALLELATFVPESKGEYYRHQALLMLRSLASPSYSAKLGLNGHFLLMHATGNQPAGSEIDVAINYADYYYLEALLRCKRGNDLGG